MPRTALFGAAAELEIIIETSLMLSGRETSLPALARRIFDAEPDLMERLREPWMLARLEGIIKQKRNAIPVEGQLTLPGMPALPRIIRLKNGSRPPFDEATIAQLREYRDILEKRRPPRLRIVKRMIEVMEPYAAKNPKVKVIRVLKLICGIGSQARKGAAS
jgi:hypothetical protein